ncbi:MAG: TrbI/VirB10 family protein [Acidobacteriaceae bacterium]
MNRHAMNGAGNREAPINVEEAAELETRERPRQQPPFPPVPETVAARPETPPAAGYATRADLKGAVGMEKNKLILLGGGLLLAVLFFVFTAVSGRSPGRRDLTGKRSSQQTQQPSTNPFHGSVTPLMDAAPTPSSDNTGGQIQAGDIERTRSTTGRQKPPASRPAANNSLGSVPSFSDTQQKWEEPRPYGTPAPGSPAQVQQQQNTLKEPSLVFVRSPRQNHPESSTAGTTTVDNAPALDLTPGTRIEAKLETQISSVVEAPVVAVVQYTYALGNKVVVPAGARVYGHLEQANRSGYVSVKFYELELLDGAREKIDAVGTDLDLGPIKGKVFGKNTGRNFLVQAASGLGSAAAMLVDNNNSAAFSENDMLRQQVAQNMGQAGDSEVMNLAVNSRVVVTVPADTKIYVVFTRHEQTPATLHRVASNSP